VHLAGDKGATDAAFARADHIVRHRLVINRVTAVTMEAARLHRRLRCDKRSLPALCAAQGVHTFRSDLAKDVLKVAESKVHVVAGDIGGQLRDEVGDLQ